MIIFILFSIGMIITLPCIALFVYKMTQSLDLFNMIMLRIAFGFMFLIFTITVYGGVIPHLLTLIKQ